MVRHRHFPARSTYDDSYLYAFLIGGVFLYVGCAVDTHRRREAHIRKRPELRNCQFEILRKVRWDDRARIETQVIQALKKRGECRLNQQTVARAPRGQLYRQDVEYRGVGYPSAVAAKRVKALTEDWELVH